MLHSDASKNTLPIDIEILNKLSGNLPTQQEELLDIFFFNVSECVLAIENHCQDQKDQVWRHAVQELSELSQRLGAKELARLCETINSRPQFSFEEKKQIISNINLHVNRLRIYIKNNTY